MIGVGWGAPFGHDLGWDWWPLATFTLLLVVLLVRTRMHVGGALGLAAIGGTAVASMTHAFGVAPVWFPLVIVVTTIRSRRRNPD